MHLDKKIDSSLFKKYNFNLLISYGYRFIIDKYVINHFGDRAINLHISYLPWIFFDPNLWSFVDDTLRVLVFILLIKELIQDQSFFKRK